MYFKIEAFCERLIHRFNLHNHLHTHIVLLIDVAMSVLASLAAIEVVEALTPSQLFNQQFSTLWGVASFIVSLVTFRIGRAYRIVIRYSTLRDLGRLCIVVIAKEILMGFIAVFGTNLKFFSEMLYALLLIDMLLTAFCIVGVRVIMVLSYDYLMRRLNRRKKLMRVLIYGTDDKSAAALTRLRNSDHYLISGFLVPDSENHKKRTLLGKDVFAFHSKESLKLLIHKLDIDGILFAYQMNARKEQDRIMAWAPELELETFIVPTVDKVNNGSISDNSVRNIKIEDLLGRSEIRISLDEVKKEFTGKTIMVTGAAGSIGSELCRQLAQFGIGHLVMYDNAETPLHNIRLEFEERFPHVSFTPVIGDVRNLPRLDFVFREFRPEIVFHAAAYKHVPLMEENPCEAVIANVLGSRNVADKCVEYESEKMVMISTDKAVNPTNIMGATKRMAEIYVQSLGLAIESGSIKGNTRFITTRFGNVLGSNGSVIPRFRDQIAKGGPVTVTHPEIQRFFMTIPEACLLVMEAATIADSTEIFAFDMGKPIKIADLATRMIRLAGLEPGIDIKVEFTGLRPGEKLYEEVLATKENTIPTEHDRIFVARVRQYDYEEACKRSDNLLHLAKSVNIPDMVILMKQIVPEFISKHSPFEIYDHPQSEVKQEKDQESE